MDLNETSTFSPTLSDAQLFRWGQIFDDYLGTNLTEIEESLAENSSSFEGLLAENSTLTKFTTSDRPTPVFNENEM